MPKKLPIITGEKNIILRTKSQELTLEEIKLQETQELIRDLALTMKENNGIGLAAPQVGKNIRIFVVSFKDAFQVCINPKITRKSLRKEIEEEGCLSLPGKWGMVKRSKKVTLEFLNQNGEKIKIKATGLLSRVLQHELDHLDGVLFIDKIIK